MEWTVDTLFSKGLNNLETLHSPLYSRLLLGLFVFLIAALILSTCIPQSVVNIEHNICAIVLCLVNCYASWQLTSLDVIWVCLFLALIFLCNTVISIISTLSLPWCVEFRFIVVIESSAIATIVPNHHIGFISLLTCHKI